MTSQKSGLKSLLVVLLQWEGGIMKLSPRRLHQNMEGQLAFFYVVPLYFRKIETFSQLLLNTCGLYFSEISCWLRKCLVPHRFMAFKPRYLQFKVYPEQGRREGNYRSDFRWEDGSWSRYEVKIQRSTGTTRPIGAPCFCLTLCGTNEVYRVEISKQIYKGELNRFLFDRYICERLRLTDISVN